MRGVDESECCENWQPPWRGVNTDEEGRQVREDYILALVADGMQVPNAKRGSTGLVTSVRPIDREDSVTHRFHAMQPRANKRKIGGKQRGDREPDTRLQGVFLHPHNVHFNAIEVCHR